MKHVPIVIVALAAALVATAGCRQRSFEERVTASRAAYEVELNGWVVREPEAPAPTAAEGGAAPTDEAGAPADPNAPAAEPAPRQVVLDLVVRHEATEPLPGITLDVTHADAAERVKEVRRIWIDTSSMYRGVASQINVTLEGVTVAPGDRFAVQVRNPIPASERADYREYRPGG